jgi:hypothetical protein
MSCSSQGASCAVSAFTITENSDRTAQFCMSTGRLRAGVRTPGREFTAMLTGRPGREVPERFLVSSQWGSAFIEDYTSRWCPANCHQSAVSSYLVLLYPAQVALSRR